MVKLLISESDALFAQAWTELFEKERFTVDCESHFSGARNKMRHDHYDVLVLQCRFPGGENGIELCRSYRNARGMSPVLLTSERHSSEEMEYGLEAGADDYMGKPIKVRELCAKVKALLRRRIVLPSLVLQVKDVTLDIGKGTVFVRGREVHLHPMELNLLEFLMAHENQVFTAEALLDRVWHDRGRASLASVRTHIKTLRHKLESRRDESLIATVRGRGYKVVN